MATIVAAMVCFHTIVNRECPFHRLRIRLPISMVHLLNVEYTIAYGTNYRVVSGESKSRSGRFSYSDALFWHSPFIMGLKCVPSSPYLLLKWGKRSLHIHQSPRYV